MKRSLILVLFSTAFIIACGANKSVIKNNVSGGDAEAKFISEECCVKSEEVYKNFAEAANRIEKLFEQNNADAQYKLGVCYEKGEGVDKNLAEAAKWYRKVAEQGDANAQRNLGLYYIQEKRDNVIGYAWIFLSVKNRLEDSTSKLAELEKQMDKGEIERAKKLAEEYSKGNFDK